MNKTGLRLALARSSAFHWATNHRAANSRRTKERRLRMESLENRNLLAIVANQDTYAASEPGLYAFHATEDTPFVATGIVTVVSDIVIPLQASGWRSFDDITSAADLYPEEVANPGLPWWTTPFNPDAAQTFGEWDTARSAPFAFGPIDRFVTDGLTVSPIDAPGANELTALFRRSFDLTAAQVAGHNAVQLTALADDGLVAYLNNVELTRINCCAPDDPLTTNSLALNTTNTETAYVTRVIDLAALGIVLSDVPGENVLAIEVHNQAAGSSDLGFNAELRLANIQPGAPPLFANDTGTPNGTVTNTLQNGDLSPSIAGWAKALSAADSSYAGIVRWTGTAAEQALGNIRFDPARNFSGTAFFFYERSDADGSTGSTVVLIDVDPVNDAPVALNDSYAYDSGAASYSAGTRGAPIIEASDHLWHWYDGPDDQEVPVTGNPTWNDGPGEGFNPAVASGWKGPAKPEFGYADDEFDETTHVTCNTTSDPECRTGGVNVISSFYFSTFDLASIPTRMELGLNRDDGGVVYINGVEVDRQNIVCPTATDPVTAACDAAGTGSETQFFTKTIDGALLASLNLQATGNHIAVRIMQDSPTSSDVSFNLRLTDTSPAVGLLGNDEDVDDTAAALSVDVASVSAVSPPGSGTVAVAADGTWMLTPASPFTSGTLTFTYRTLDAAGAPSATATVSVILTPVLVTAADTYSMDEDTPLTTVAASSVLLPRSSAGWSYLDQIKNGLEQDPDGAPQDYPVDGATLPWNDPLFNTTTSTIGPWGTGAMPLQVGGITAFPAAPDTLAGIDCAVPAGMDPATTDNCVTTYLFRRTFNVPGGAALKTLRMDTIADDGFRVFINGQPVQQHLLPQGAIATDTPATGTGDEDGAINGVYDVYSLNVDGIMLDGDNVIAVELHQSANDSSDAGINVELSTWPGVLANDSTPNPPLTAALVPLSGPTNGTLDFFNADGTFKYTPNANFAGTDTFQYTASDGVNPTSGPTTVTINVRDRPESCANDTDLNDSGNTNGADLVLLLANYGATAAGLENAGDVNCDGSVGLMDLAAMQLVFTNTAPSPSANSATGTGYQSSGDSKNGSSDSDSSNGGGNVDRPVRQVRTAIGTRASDRRTTMAAPRPNVVTPPQTASSKQTLRTSRTTRAAAHDRAMDQMFG